jgi:hypothetical protein
MRLAQCVRFARFDALPREPALCQFEQDYGFRLVDLEEHGGVDVNAAEDDPRVVGCAVTRISVVAEPGFQSGSYGSSILARSFDTRATPEADTHSYEPISSVVSKKPECFGFSTK